MLIVPLQATPSQTLNCLLNQQSISMDVTQRTTGLFLNLYINNALILGGVVCEDRNRIVRDSYLGFSGDLAFIDGQGASDPDYTGLGGRFNLWYFAPEDLVA